MDKAEALKKARVVGVGKVMEVGGGTVAVELTTATTKPFGDPELDALWAKVEQLRREGKIPERHTREEKIDWVLGNLNLSTNHRTTREAVERAFDDLERKKKPLQMFFNEADYVIAHDVADAIDVCKAFLAKVRDDDDIYGERFDPDTWGTVDHEKLFTFYDGHEGRKQTIGAWVAEHGRGYFCSEDY